ncbi:hypothetical protein ACFL0O_09805 [Thermodesulfobacteriota bacterium]
MDPNNPAEPNKGHLKGRSVRDRRSGEDRRETYNLNYFYKGGVERRKMYERRCRRIDRRKKWVLVDTSCSVPEDI